MRSFAHMSSGDVIRDVQSLNGITITRQWAWGAAYGNGVRVCIIDSGISRSHPALVNARIDRSLVVQPSAGSDERFQVVADPLGDVSGHGTACAGIVHMLAPNVTIDSVRILGANLGAAGGALIAALEWALEQRYDLINLSLSTRREAYKQHLHDLADQAYFSGTAIVAAAHNSPVDSFPWRFASVVSVGSHAVNDPEYLEASASPPVEFFARGVRIAAPWSNGTTSTVSGNSFATPHVTGLLARIKSKHQMLGVAQLKQVLTAVSNNLLSTGRQMSGEEP